MIMLEKNIELHLNYENQGSLKCGCNSVVECKLPKLDVTGSNPVARLVGFGRFESNG